MNNEAVDDPAPYAEFRRVIRLIPKQKDESQYELWEEAINETVRLDSRVSRIDWLKKYFIIQRKKS